MEKLFKQLTDAVKELSKPHNKTDRADYINELSKGIKRLTNLMLDSNSNTATVIKELSKSGVFKSTVQAFKNNVTNSTKRC